MSTSGEPGPNLHAAAVAAAELLTAGFYPFVPHVTWFLHMVRPDVDVQLWRAWGLEWLQQCDCVLRLPGASVGADDEVIEAHVIGLRVYYKGAEHLIKTERALESSSHKNEEENE